MKMDLIHGVGMKLLVLSVTESRIEMKSIVLKWSKEKGKPTEKINYSPNTSRIFGILKEERFQNVELTNDVI